MSIKKVQSNGARHIGLGFVGLLVALLGGRSVGWEGGPEDVDLLFFWSSLGSKRGGGGGGGGPLCNLNAVAWSAATVFSNPQQQLYL